MIKKIVLLFAVTLTLIFGSFFILLEQQMAASIKLSQPQLLTLKKGSSIGSFSKQLVNQGWISNRFWLRNYIRLHPAMAQLKAGTYQVKAGTPLLNLIEQLVAGKEHQFTVTFIEGSTFVQWLSLLTQQKNLVQTLSEKSTAQISSALGIKNTVKANNPEGLFFPDTYAYTAGTTDLMILQWALMRMQNKLAALWHSRAQDLPYQDAYQALVMASIIEKETGQREEQGLIASVFINRLRKRMRLQTDPTVIYGLGSRYQGDIKRIHLRQFTPYNTYRINGLPPTPIAMPGISAIAAALQPDISDYFYFVSQGNGYHVFSTNLSQHNAAVARFQLTKKPLSNSTTGKK